MDNIESRCVACGEFISYCLGHGEIGDPAGFAILAEHDNDYHVNCDPRGCRAEVEPTCDICGRHMEDSRAGFADADWNGETGNHETCEEYLRREQRGETFPYESKT